MRVGANPKSYPSSDCLAATRRHEVGIMSNRESSRHGERYLNFVLTACQAP